MSASKRPLIAALVAALATVPLLAAPVRINLATLAPASTTWHKALLDMGDTWKKTTEGRVSVTVFGGGNLDEETIITKMRPGFETVQAAFLTAAGLAGIDVSFNAFSIPFFLESDAEEQAVEAKLTPLIEQKLQAKGYHFLAWGTGGWVQVFSKKPLRTLAEVKAAKLYMSKGSDDWLGWYVKNGFHPVALLPANIPEQLKLATGMIDTAPLPPYVASTLQIHKDAKYMLDLHIAPLPGALIMANSAWTKISPEDQAKVTAAAKAFEARVRTETPAQDAAALKVMTAAGLQVITLDAKTAAEFRGTANQLLSTLNEAMVPKDVLTLAMQERDAFRKAKGK
jgi:TRAP-type C4-dicarboxylate transport system substrate-binding protein